MTNCACTKELGPAWLYRAIAVVYFVLVVVSSSIPAASSERLGSSYACGAPESITTEDGVVWEPDRTVAPASSNIAKVGLDYIRYFSPYSSTNQHENGHCFDKLPEVESDGPLLLRATFKYSNYDGLDDAPEFEMWVGTAVVAYINLKKNDPWIEEVIYQPTAKAGEQVFCLLSVKGAPVISFIELRPLPLNAYASNSILFRKAFRIDCGNLDRSLRYPEDDYDRIWGQDEAGFSSGNSAIFTSTVNLDGSDIPEKPPAAVLNSFRNSTSGTELSYNLAVESSGSFSVKLYTPSSKIMSVQVGSATASNSSTLGESIQVTTFSSVTSVSGSIGISLQGPNGSEINALEVLEEIVPTASSTDADSMDSIRRYYKLRLDWYGDPCIPAPWERLQCTSSDHQVTHLDLSNQNIVLPVISDFTSLRSLTHLNLSFNKLSFEIPDLTGLNQLEVLDLRNNDFYGTLDILGGLPALTNLFVSFNPRLTGAIPSSLRRNNLDIETQGTCVDQGPNCTSPVPPEETVDEKKSSNGKTGIIIGVVIAAVLAFLVIAGLIVFMLCWKRKPTIETAHEAQSRIRDFRYWSAAKVFTFKEVEIASQHFKKQLGEGSFGPVYYGVLSNGQRIAIKMRHDTSQLGAEAFANEVFLLSRVHHPNLVPLLGYCQEGRNQLLVYEYMPGGTLTDHLYGTMNRLDWVARLRIAIGAATGISYLHNESEPKIIHRDVKSSNILLDSNMIAKVSDFGLSKLVTRAEATHVTTLVKGTAGYLDPEYFTTNQLTEKSDVYSFGVVLLEIICGREPLTDNRPPDEYNLIAWARPHLLARSYDTIVDRGLEKKYNPRGISLVCSLAARCIERNAENRPTMHQVLRELEEALILEDRLDNESSSSQQPSSSYSAAFDFKSTASDTPPDSAPQLANVPSFTFPR